MKDLVVLTPPEGWVRLSDMARIVHKPARTLRDENIARLTALSVLEAVGRGAEKPSPVSAPGGDFPQSLRHEHGVCVWDTGVPV